MIHCPCCNTTAKNRDVWYDCRCFRDGKKSCANCRLTPTGKAEGVAAAMRKLGWDKDPSPGMLDYLTPGWR